MIEKIPVSVYVLTTNNRRTIERCLKSLSWAEEVVVVDSFSQDGTYEVCKQYADEEIPPGLAEEIRAEINRKANDTDGYFVYRRTYYLGRWIRYGGWYPDGEIRIYRRNKGRWEGGLHAKLAVDGKIGVLKNQYHHYTYGNISDQIQTIDKYSEIAAQDLLESGKTFSLLKLLFHPPFRFIKEYLLKLGFRDGLPGFVIIVSTMFYVFIKYAKLWELQHAKHPSVPSPLAGEGEGGNIPSTPTSILPRQGGG